MNFLKRAVTSISRRPGKTIILLILIFILGSIIAGAISVEGAITNTETNLRRNMPSIVSIGADEARIVEEFNQTGEFPEVESITAELVREIGELPYVREFNYSVSAYLQSFNLRNYSPEMEGTYPGWGEVPGFPIFFELAGVSGENLIHIDQGLIEVVDGRMLTDDEINRPNDEDVMPAFVSSSFAEVNQLQVGSLFSLSNMVNERDSTLSDSELFLEENLLGVEDYQFQIVGLFDMVDREELGSDDWDLFMHQREVLNQIYVPNHAAEKVDKFRTDIRSEMETDDANQSDEAFKPSITSLFILEDPLYINDFKAAVEPLLPDFVGIDDLSNTFDDIASAMKTLQQIADWVLWTAIGATLFILSLLMTLFLRDRRYEMGIYLALGEKKLKIISQILIEVVVTAFAGITLAVFAGNAISSGMSQAMLRNALAQTKNESLVNNSNFATSVAISGSNSLEGMGFGQEMTPEEMMKAFDVSLHAHVILIIYGIGLAAVVVSTLIPVVYIIRLNPKKVLMGN